jgi:hypothetical protein
VRSYTLDETPPAEQGFMTRAKYCGSQGIFVPELCLHNHASQGPVFLMVLHCIAMFALIILLETNVINDTGVPLSGNFFKNHMGNLGVMALLTLIAIPSMICFADCSYFIFKNDKVIYQSKYRGRRIYNSKDLKFHLFQIEGGHRCFQLEIELPDPSIPLVHRQIIVECTASRKNMDGIVSVFFPLIRGKTEPYYFAVPHKIEPIVQEEGKNIWWGHYNNLTKHFWVWFWGHKVNQFIFWLVHGSQEKLMAKERKRDDIFSL